MKNYAKAKQLSQDFREFGKCTIKEFNSAPTTDDISLLIAQNQPALFKNSFNYPKKWAYRKYLEEHITSSFPVAVTPDGLADSAHLIDGSYCFIEPHVAQMTIDQFLEGLNKHPVLYLQSQNDNLSSNSLKSLSFDLQMPSFLGNNNALNSLDASNIWIGSDQSVTSLHKDHYENFVGGVMGVKTFSLYPPTDFGYIKYEKCIPCIHDPPSSNSTLWSIKRLEGTHVNWIVDVDPCIDPITVDIYPGDMLYLPSLWYHSVKMKSERFKDNNGQTACISINYWFDMDFGDRYCFMKYLARSLQEDN